MKTTCSRKTKYNRLNLSTENLISQEERILWYELMSLLKCNGGNTLFQLSKSDNVEPCCSVQVYVKPTIFVWFCYPSLIYFVDFCILTLFFYKNNFIRTKALILAKNLRTSSEQSQACCPTEHKNKVSRTKCLWHMVCI